MEYNGLPLVMEESTLEFMDIDDDRSPNNTEGGSLSPTSVKRSVCSFLTQNQNNP